MAQSKPLRTYEVHPLTAASSRPKSVAKAYYNRRETAGDWRRVGNSHSCAAQISSWSEIMAGCQHPPGEAAWRPGMSDEELKDIQVRTKISSIISAVCLSLTALDAAFRS